VEGALRQAGVIRVSDFGDLMNLGKAFSLHPDPVTISSPGGNGVAMITVTGGGGVVMTDLVRSSGMTVPGLEKKTIQALAKIFPPWMAPNNPVDIWPAIEQKGLGVFGTTLREVLADARVDGVALLTFASRMLEHFPFKEIGEEVRRSGKAVVCWLFGDRRYFDVMEERLRAYGIPVYNDLHSCVLSLQAYLSFSKMARDGMGSDP
jgi:acyl-CoA synthetase (NDP forming)